jgi:hypothetical protein
LKKFIIALCLVLIVPVVTFAATRCIAIEVTDSNLAVSGNGADITYKIAITDPTMAPVFQGAIIDFVTANMTNTDTLTTFATKVKNAMQVRAGQSGFTCGTYVLPSYAVN